MKLGIIIWLKRVSTMSLGHFDDIVDEEDEGEEVNSDDVDEEEDIDRLMVDTTKSMIALHSSLFVEVCQ